MERNSAVSSLPGSVLCVCTPTGVFTSHVFEMPFLCDAEASDTSRSLRTLFIPLSNSAGIMVPVAPQQCRGTKKELMQMPWLFHHSRNVERKNKNQCCQVSRIDRESRVSIRLLGERYQQYEVACVPQNSHNKVT